MFDTDLEPNDVADFIKSRLKISSISQVFGFRVIQWKSEAVEDIFHLVWMILTSVRNTEGAMCRLVCGYRAYGRQQLDSSDNEFYCPAKTGSHCRREYESDSKVKRYGRPQYLIAYQKAFAEKFGLFYGDPPETPGKSSYVGHSINVRKAAKEIVGIKRWEHYKSWLSMKAADEWDNLYPSQKKSVPKPERINKFMTIDDLKDDPWFMYRESKKQPDNYLLPFSSSILKAKAKLPKSH